MASACNAALFDFVFCHRGSSVSCFSIIVDIAVFVEDINNASGYSKIALLMPHISLADLGLTASTSFSVR